MKKKTNILILAAGILCLAGCGKGGSEVIKKESYNVEVLCFEDNAATQEIDSALEEKLTRIGKERNTGISINFICGENDEDKFKAAVDGIDAENTDVVITADSRASEILFNEETDLPVIYITNSYELKKELAYNACIYYEQNTGVVFDMIKAVQPELEAVGILYNGNDKYSSYYAEQAKEECESLGIKYIEKTAENSSEAEEAASLLSQEGAEAVFSPEDGVVLSAEENVSGILTQAGIPHYTTSAVFTKHGAFAAYGDNLEKAGYAAADCVVDIVINKKEVKDLGVTTLAASNAAVNINAAKELDLDYSPINDVCDKVAIISTPVNGNESS